ncbi:hypothetical protein [Prescottella sp. R16]|uniref:hypothetical protein n=1 Tax=Prescottella sp. R16 TaxID=3064529 RepID=UPI00272E2EEA|nr:hypothetical protein [Prescottella sp. R16]
MVENYGWEGLTAVVEAGDLSMDPGTAKQCARKCVEFADKLRVIRERAHQLGRVEGFGTLPSGLALKAKFEAKAVGGEYSMVQALTDHIDEVERMRTVFETIERRYAETEQANASMIGAIDPE